MLSTQYCSQTDSKLFISTLNAYSITTSGPLRKSKQPISEKYL